MERCLDDGRYTQAVITQSEEAKKYGIGGIPAYIIGEFLIEGAQPYEVFQKAMEAVLSKRK